MRYPIVYKLGQYNRASPYGRSLLLSGYSTKLAETRQVVVADFLVKMAARGKLRNRLLLIGGLTTAGVAAIAGAKAGVPILATAFPNNSFLEGWAQRVRRREEERDAAKKSKQTIDGP